MLKYLTYCVSSDYPPICARPVYSRKVKKERKKKVDSPEPPAEDVIQSTGRSIKIGTFFVRWSAEFCVGVHHHSQSEQRRRGKKLPSVLTVGLFQRRNRLRKKITPLRKSFQWRRARMLKLVRRMKRSSAS